MSDEYSHYIASSTTGGWDRPDKAMKLLLVVGSVTVVITWWLAGTLMGIGTILVVTLLYVPIYGPMKRSGVGAIEARLRARRIRRSGGLVHQHDLRDAVLQLDEGTHSLQQVRQPKGWSSKIISFRPKGWTGQLAFFRCKGGGVDDIVAVVLIDGAPRLVWAEERLRYNMDNRIVGALKRGVDSTMQNLVITQFVLCRPADATKPLREREKRWHKDFLDAEEETTEGNMVEWANADDNDAYRESLGYKMGWAFRMPFPRAWRNRDLNELTADDVQSTDVMRVVRTVIKGLSGVVENPRLPTLFELNELGFLVFNANRTDLTVFHHQMHLDIQAEKAGDLRKLEDAVTLSNGPFPGLVSLHDDHVRTNRTLHATLFLKHIPRGAYTAGFLDGLFRENIPYIYVDQMFTTDYTASLKRHKFRRKARDVASGMTPGDKSPEYNPELAEAAADAAAQHNALFQSRSRATLRRTYLITSGDSCEEAQRNLARMQTSATNYGLRTVQLLGTDPDVQFEPLKSALGLYKKM